MWNAYDKGLNTNNYYPEKYQEKRWKKYENWNIINHGRSIYYRQIRRLTCR